MVGLRQKSGFRRHRRAPRLKGLSINRLIPNILTVLALCAGLTAIRFALNGEWQQAVIAIFAAAILDGLDGRMARLLKATSKFGAELDSLSDFISFGVAPAVVLYMWGMSGVAGFGWAVVLFFATCAALRLARFNTKLGDPELPAYAYNYFSGVPAPAGAGLALLPMILSFDLGYDTVLKHPALVIAWVFFIGLLMVSAIPTFSGKKARIPQGLVIPMLIVVGLLVAALVNAPWRTLSGLGLLYLLCIPFSVRSYRRLKAEAEQMVAQHEADIAASGDAVPESGNDQSGEPRPGA
ncbi:CDP-diacylglycerol--serine O-phosphatidyltransferase [Oceanibaculum indicum]|uniref:CDP-diacylglycerol--serine O-phosphatidyltransferase n=1 Tax=Oceanibaculum indicum TaxID=526216 RepID=A0A420WPD7_9PROT|nr:CDP-diacylglycerol--serine O-phosphatidyltransferase [Oceanibaculum indicum]RKQ72725.1 CDP-diacylglycerol--serine O-phosphatidyltransferase [Oceanibaculum indicum]